MSIELLAYIIAIAIPVFYIYTMRILDLFGTTKLQILFICLLWGATGAFGLAYGINNWLIGAIGFALVAGLTAPITEEILKALVIFYYTQRPQFRYVVDGAIYGFTVGIGFAAVENILYINRELGGGALTLAISRVLSTNLMHATASGIVGVSMGNLRSARSPMRRAWDYAGILLAITIHIAFNQLVGSLEGPLLLLVAIAFGIGGGVFVGFLINQGLAEAKERFNETLGMNVGVSIGERQAVQNIGSSGMEHVFKEMEESFGAEKIHLIRRLLATQANIGILQNNLKGPASQRLRTAWEKEVEELKVEVENLRKQLGIYVTSYMNRIFPEASDPMWQEELGRYDPSLVHTFDMFMRVSELAHSFTPEQLEERAERLSAINLFQHIPLPDLENLSRAITIRDLKDGEMLFDLGDDGDVMYLIQDGDISIIILNQDGTEETIKTLSAGSVVGEFAVLDGEPRSARGRAKGDLTVMELNRQTFLQFIQSRPHVILLMLQVLAKKARITTHSVEESIKNARLIADGKYQELTAMRAETKTYSRTELFNQPKEQLITSDGDVHIDEETVQELQQSFAEAAAAIEQNEKALREQIA